MSVGRKRFLTGLAMSFEAAAIRTFPAGAAEFSYRLGEGYPLTHPTTLRSQEAAAKIATESGGRIEIKVFPNNQLGGDMEQVAQARIGAVQFLISGYQNFMSLVPITGILAIPFSFPDTKAARAAMDGPLGRFARTALANANLGFVPIAKSMESGFRQVGNNVRPLRVADDFKGLKIRVPNFPPGVEMFKALGATPSPIGTNEIYTALQTHLVDGADVTLAAVDSGKYYEVEKYLSITNHLWAANLLVANTAAWQALPEKLRDVVERNFSNAATLERADVVSAEQALQKTLEGHGVAFNQGDIGSFRGALRDAGLYAKWRGQFGPEVWALLEAAAGKLTT